MTKILMTASLHAALRTLQKADAKNEVSAIMSDDLSEAENIKKAKAHVENYIQWREAAEVVSRVLRQ
jgi:hypothetical protein